MCWSRHLDSYIGRFGSNEMGLDTEVEPVRSRLMLDSEDGRRRIG